MILSAVSGPLIGAVIGYCTNYIAVKMLFRPLRPIKLFGRTLPFTPGVIPKGQARLARAAGNVVGGELLTQEELERTLLSDDTKNEIRSGIAQWLESHRDSAAEMEDILPGIIGGAEYQSGREMLGRELTDKITDRVSGMDIGNLVAEQVVAGIRERVRGTLLAMMVNEETLQNLILPIGDKINSYIDEHAEDFIAPAVGEELYKAEHKTAGELLTEIEENGVDVTEAVMRLYELAVEKYLSTALKTIDLAGIVERKINGLEPAELEKLVLSIMKKELNVVVNLGALIGFVLGLLNLLF